MKTCQSVVMDYPPFDSCDEQCFENSVDNEFERICIPALTVINELNEPIQKVGCVCSGVVELLVETDQGEMIRTGCVSEGEYFGIEVLFGKGISLFNVLSIDPVECFVIEKERFFELVSRYVSVKEYFEEQLAQRLKQTMCTPLISSSDIQKHNMGASSTSLKRAIEYIDNHYTQNISLNDLARINCLSRYYFCRRFKEETGYRFKDYLNLKRLSAARKLLMLPDVNISQACFSVGFNDVSYFSRVFKKYVGVSPSAYKKGNC